jgi:hypothetical protein
MSFTLQGSIFAKINLCQPRAIGRKKRYAPTACFRALGFTHTKGANAINKVHTWAKPYKLFLILPTQFRTGSNALPRSQQMIQERNRMRALVCLVRLNRKKSTLLTYCLQSNWYVSQAKKRQAICLDSSSYSFVATYRLLGWYGRRYREYALR